MPDVKPVPFTVRRKDASPAVFDTGLSDLIVRPEFGGWNCWGSNTADTVTVLKLPEAAERVTLQVNGVLLEASHPVNPPNTEPYGLNKPGVRSGAAVSVIVFGRVGYVAPHSGGQLMM
jgi:hypothetical protein